MPATTYPLFMTAPAKINLTLDVLGKRADGYHALASVMQTIALYDTLAFHPAPSDTVSLHCTDAALGGTDNLALRAAHLLRTTTGYQGGVRIELVKQIPVQGGLGGGSSDGATALLALNRLWELALDTPTLIDLAAQLGSDVPFFILGGTALIEGRGEFVTPLPPLSPFWLIIAKPPVNVATAAVFHALSSTAYTNGDATNTLVAAIQSHTSLTFDDATLVNALEPAVLHTYPAVAATRALLLQAGAPLVRMSGSGPTLFAPFATLAAAHTVWQAAHALGVTSWLTHTV